MTPSALGFCGDAFNVAAALDASKLLLAQDGFGPTSFDRPFAAILTIGFFATIDLMHFSAPGEACEALLDDICLWPLHLRTSGC
jgi:hypothetical protein